MSDQNIQQNKYGELRSIYKYYIDAYITLYQLKTEKEEDLNSIYQMIKTELIESKKHLPQNIIRDILDMIPYNNRYTKSYLTLAKLISDEYQVKDISNVNPISNFLFYKEYGIKLNKSTNFAEINPENVDIHTENTIYKAIMCNEKEQFISFTEREGFDKDQILISKLYPSLYLSERYTLLELCCYHGAVDCFKFLRTKFDSKITETCLVFSFLGGNPEIMSECLKYQRPNDKCMEYAIISHNIDFVAFLMNEYDKTISLQVCGIHKILEAFLVYFDQTDASNKCFVYSAMFNFPSLAEYFLSHGGYINEKDEFGHTALHHAARNNNTEMVEFLISHGANISERDYESETALHYAAHYNCKETAELLIRFGADLSERDHDGQTALHYAAHYNFKEISNLLISHDALINEKDKNGKTALHCAACNNCPKETAEFFISHGANINEKDGQGKIALHYAALKDNKETTEFLILHGANINEKIIMENLLFIIQQNTIVKKQPIFLFRMVRISMKKDKYERTAIHYAALTNNKETSNLLISHGANVNESDKYGKTALHYTAENNFKETAEILISHDANINEKDKYGQTALHLAINANHKEVAELLVSHGANTNEKDEQGKTALHYAAEYNRKELAELLISHGANINEKDRQGKTALHYAASKNSKETVELLISHGANINEKDGEGKTALNYADDENRKEMAELLISHGAIKYSSFNRFISSLFEKK
ncbi:KIAA1223 protein, putative [Trichomonas vaginalis G3]|uniref:KIAA1223 protein, putative n=1 Tax=Trichomonas vaginalis (strain ATCC PRA-98 / G3) TaxID=412133 RepID=A2ECV3_TRIV3|nr:ankyrin repeat and SOCS box-containing protein 4 family [Trichomonas vaginalis G3]EAY09498.1 KIAA1223 protein, putative [Trichomonas vaginalis G3]KAI5521429.1 ankyrin repeat and SOCS box-containing protein 4 family [Trichomonas vaginalis G3]|eukprot:XP_001321721.1 KIAA1223 protein [Trichomonas vaginalis G3]